MNNTSLEELASSLRSHEIELERNKSQKQGKYVALKSVRKSEKSKDLQAEEIVDFVENSDEFEDELSLLSRKVNHLWKRSQDNKNRNAKSTDGHFESTSGQRKSRGKEVIC